MNVVTQKQLKWQMRLASVIFYTCSFCAVHKGILKKITVYFTAPYSVILSYPAALRCVPYLRYTV